MKKKLVILGAAALTAAAAVPALAFENEFHGMYTGAGYSSNFFNGTTNGPAYSMTSENHSGFFAEQRARLQYIAKASDDLKLVTHFELDSRFGGTTPYKGTTGSDAGTLDADTLTLETKNVYLDVKCPITGTNVKVGLQPWADSYKSLFLLADMTGVSATKKFNAVTANAAWFRYADNGAATTQTPGDKTADIFVLDGKFAISKDATVGASYYYLNDYSAYNNIEVGAGAPIKTKNRINMVGVNGSFNVGPATIDPFAAYQFGTVNDSASNGTPDVDVSSYLLGATAKVKVGKGTVNLAAIYLSGSEESDNDVKSFLTVNRNQTYFNPANMWLLVRNANAVNSSTSVLDNDMTVGGSGLIGVFAGYAGSVDKMFYAANIGYAETAEEAAPGADKSLGTEVNATVGYNVFDNLKVSLNAAGLFLGEALDGNDGQRATRYDSSATTNANIYRELGAKDADYPWMANVMVQYAF